MLIMFKTLGHVKTKRDKIDTPFKKNPGNHTLSGRTSPLWIDKGVSNSVVYHLHGQTSWSTICAKSRQNIGMGKFRSRLACTICAVHSNSQRESGTSHVDGAGPGTGR